MSLELPQFSGLLIEDVDLFCDRLEAYFRLHQRAPLSQADKLDLLLLAIQPNTTASFFVQQQLRIGYSTLMDRLKKNFGSSDYKALSKTAAKNALGLRRFRDSSHGDELVEHLLDDLGKLHGRAGVIEDGEMKESLLR